MAIKAAKISVSLEAKSAKFSEALDRAQRQAQTSSSGVIRALAKMETKSKEFDKNVSAALWSPFRLFKKHTAGFIIAGRLIGSTLKNVLAPFKKLGTYIAGPFVTAMRGATKAFGLALNMGKRMAMGIAGGVLAFSAMTIASAKSSLEIKKWATMLGVSYTELNELSYAASLNNITVEQMSTSMTDLTAKIEDAAFAGSGALVPFFTSINQKAEDWQNLSPTEQLLKFSDELSKMDYQTALYWADEVNGAMAEMTPLLYKGSGYFKEMREEARMFGAEIDGTDNLKKISGMVTRIKFSIRNFFTGVGATMAPGIIRAWDTGMAHFKKHLQKLGGGEGKEGEGFKTLVQQFSGNLLIAIGGMVNGVQDAMKKVGEVFDGLMSAYNWISDLMGGKSVLKNGALEQASELQQKKYNELSTKKDKRDLAQAEWNRAKLAQSTAVQARKAYEESKDFGTFGDDGYKKDDAKWNQLNAAVSSTQQSFLTANNDKWFKTEDVTDELNKLTGEINSAYKPIQKVAEETESWGDSIIEYGNNVLNDKTVFSESKEDKEQREAIAKAKANKAKVTTDANAEFRKATGSESIEIGVNKAAELAAKYEGVSAKSAVNLLKINEKFDQQRVMISANATREIALLKGQETEDNKANIATQIADLKIKEKASLNGLEVTRKAEVEAFNDKIEADKKAAEDKAKRDIEEHRAEERLARNKLRAEQDFRESVRALNVRYNVIDVNEKEERNRKERKEFIDLYDQRLDYLHSQYGSEHQLYKNMLDEKKAALETFTKFQNRRDTQDNTKDNSETIKQDHQAERDTADEVFAEEQRQKAKEIADAKSEAERQRLANELAESKKAHEVEKAASKKAEQEEIAAEKTRLDTLLKEEATFQEEMRQLKIAAGIIVVDDKVLQDEQELQALTELYDERLAKLEESYTTEDQMYKDMLAEKAAALLEWKELQAEADAQEVQDKKDRNVQVGNFNLQEIQDASKNKEDQKQMTIDAGKDLLAEGAKHNKKMFEMNKAVKIAEAMMSTYKGAAAAMEWGMPMGPIFAALITAQGMLQVNAIRQQKFVGQFHDGYDSLPETGTYIGQKGERVVGNKTNGDLKDFLLRENSGNGRGNNVQAGFTNNFNSTRMTNSELIDVLREQPDEFRKMVSDFM